MSLKTGPNTGVKKGGSQQSGGGQRMSVTSQPSTSSSYLPQAPLVLTPVSQLDRTPRRTSRTSQPDIGVKNMPLDPDHYNPDGSLRTMHRLPAFEDRYEQARNAHYIRHNHIPERDTELSVAQIFGKKN